MLADLESCVQLQTAAASGGFELRKTILHYNEWLGAWYFIEQVQYTCDPFYFNCRVESEQVNKTKLTGSFSWPHLVCLDPCLSSFCSIQKSGLGTYPGSKI